MGSKGRVLLTMGSGHYAAAATLADLEGALNRCREFGCELRLESEAEDWIVANLHGELWRLERGNRSSDRRECSGYDVGLETVGVAMELFLEADPRLEIVVRWEPSGRVQSG